MGSKVTLPWFLTRLMFGPYLQPFTTPFLLAIFNSLTVHLGIWDRNCIPSCSIVAKIEASWGKGAKWRAQEGDSGKGVHQLPCPGAWDSIRAAYMGQCRVCWGSLNSLNHSPRNPISSEN